MRQYRILMGIKLFLYKFQASQKKGIVCSKIVPQPLMIGEAMCIISGL